MTLQSFGGVLLPVASWWLAAGRQWAHPDAVEGRSRCSPGLVATEFENRHSK